MCPRVPVFNKHIAVDLTVSGKILVLFIDIYCVQIHLYKKIALHVSALLLPVAAASIILLLSDSATVREDDRELASSIFLITFIPLIFSRLLIFVVTIPFR